MKWLFLVPLVMLLGYFLWRPEPLPPNENGPQTINPPVVATATPTQKETRPPAAEKKVETLQLWLAPYQTPRGLSVREGSTGEITTVSGFSFPTSWNSADEGLGFAQQFAERMGIPSEQIKIASASPPDTEYTKQYKYSQSYQGFQVFSAYLQLSQNNKNGDIFLATNELKKLGQPDLSSSVTADQIQQSLKKTFGETIETVPMKPHQQIYSAMPGYSELAWVYIVNINGLRKDRKLVLVSAKDGRILVDQPLAIE